MLTEMKGQIQVTSLVNSFSEAQKGVRKEDLSINHQLLLQAGFVRQEAAGIYTLMPFGLRVMRKIEDIIRTGMNDLGAEEILMPALQSKSKWLQTGRWDSVDILFKTKSRYSNSEYVLGPTHEEIVTSLAADKVKTWKDLPFAVWQIQTKFRDEKRAKSGLIRVREFGMKDMYSFHANPEDLHNFYDRVIPVYIDIFKKAGLDVKVVEASGGDFTKKHSHEFMAISNAGEDKIVYCPDCTFAQNVDISELRQGNSCPNCSSKLAVDKSVEVGNIFDLGTKFSENFDLYYTDKEGKRNSVYMGCYGLGTTRLLGTTVEINHDERGIIWPKSITPYNYHLVILDENDTEVIADSTLIINKIKRSGLSVLIDNRNTSAGDKFATADLIGISERIVISRKTNQARVVEIKDRRTSEVSRISISDFLTNIKSE